MARRKYGDWSRLTAHLIRNGQQTIALSDDEMQKITRSVDKTRPYDIDFTNPRYSIRRRAEDAGYDVYCSPNDRSTKVFTKRS